MSSPLDFTDVFLSLLPGGSLWRPDISGDLIKMLQGCGDNHQTLRDFLETLAYLRDPQNTPILSDLEKEYGLINNNSGLTEQQRRDRLDGIVYAPRGTGSASYLQAQLQASGFDVYVYQNSPTTDPGAFYGGPGGELIVNTKGYDPAMGPAYKHESLWPFIFFIGGEAVLNNSGRIIHIDPVVISDALKPAFREVVLKCKPVHSWALAVINAESYFTFSVDDSATASTTKGFASADWSTGGWFYETGLGWDLVLVDDATGDALYDASDSAFLVDG